ncbi:MAG: BON domain-containing protein [Limisphaerales bacterium]
MKKFIKQCGLVACMMAAVSLATFTTGCAGDRYSRSTGETFDDAGTTARVKSSMLADPQVSGLDVKVDTFRGTVQLTGFVDSPEQKQRAEQIARQSSGVQFVQNDIIVKMDEAAGAQPRLNQNQRPLNQRNGAGVEVEADANRTPNGAELEIRTNTNN